MDGDYEILDDTDTKEKCSIAVRDQYPNATGVNWSETYLDCYAVFGNSLDYYDNSYHFWSCKMNGKK